MTSYLGIHPVIPPRKNARYDQNGDRGSNEIYRNGAILVPKVFGSDMWKEQVNYHRRSLVETAVFQLKGCLGAFKKSNIEKQWVETMVENIAPNMLTVFASDMLTVFASVYFLIKPLFNDDSWN